MGSITSANSNFSPVFSDGGMQMAQP